MRYWHWFRSTDIDDSDVRHYLAVNPTIIQENDLLGKLEDTNILLEQDEKGTCIFEEIWSKQPRPKRLQRIATLKKKNVK